MARPEIKEHQVRLGNGILKINNVDVGLLKDVEVAIERATATIAYHNGKLPPRGKIMGAKLKATLGQIHLENLKTIFGGELTTVQSPNKKKVLTYDDLVRTINMYPVEFINTNDKNKTFGIKFFKAYASNGLSFNFPDEYDLESTMEVPVELEAYPNEDGKYAEIFDEQDVEA